MYRKLNTESVTKGRQVYIDSYWIKTQAPYQFTYPLLKHLYILGTFRGFNILQPCTSSSAWQETNSRDLGREQAKPDTATDERWKVFQAAFWAFAVTRGKKKKNFTGHCSRFSGIETLTGRGFGENRLP